MEYCHDQDMCDSGTTSKIQGNSLSLHCKDRRLDPLPRLSLQPNFLFPSRVSGGGYKIGPVCDKEGTSREGASTLRRFHFKGKRESCLKRDNFTPPPVYLYNLPALLMSSLTHETIIRGYITVMCPGRESNTLDS